MFPNFRKIFCEFRSAAEERIHRNGALFKFYGFVLLVVGMLLGRGRLISQVQSCNI